MLNPDNETMKAILDTAERFVERELKEGLFERDAYPYHEFAGSALAAASEAGLLLITAPEERGGIGLPPAAWALVLERVAYADAGFAASLLAHALALEALLASQSSELKKTWIAGGPKLLASQIYLQSDDLQDLPPAEKRADGHLLSGSARMVANAPAADAAVIAADLGDEGPGLFLVPLSEDERPVPVEMLGLRGCPVGHLELEDLKVPADHLLLSGEAAISALHQKFHLAAAAIALATLKGSLDYAIEYGRERYQGGKMIYEHSQLRSMYGRMAAEHAVLRTAWLKLVADGHDREQSLSLKAMAGELAIRGATDGVQLLGGYGSTMEYPQERRMRDARQAAEILGSPARLRLSLIENILKQTR